MNFKNNISMKRLLFFFSCFTGSLCFSQEFIMPYEGGIPLSWNCYVITSQGDSLVGKPTFVLGGTRGIRKISILTDTGEKRILKAEAITKLGFKNNGLVKTMSVLERSTSLKKIGTTNWKQIFNRDYLVYERALLPSGKRYALMQTLNPGFDSRIKVFYSQGGRKTYGVPLPSAIKIGPLGDNSMRLTGDMPRVYWISKNAGKVFKVKKGKYNKQKFQKIFGDCPLMLEFFGGPYRFRDLPEHVFYYDQLTKKQ